MPVLDITTPSKTYEKMSRHYRLADDLEAGTFAMRDRGTEWLPDFRGESDEEYAWRKSNAYCKPMLARAADLIIGHIFREGVDRTDLNLDESIVEDFDKQGASIDDYAAKIARQLLTHGIAHTYTDFPKVEGQRSLADEQSGAIRPYAIQIEPSDLFFALADYIAGAEVTVDARWRVRVYEASNGGDEEVEEIRRVFIAKEDEIVPLSGGGKFEVRKGQPIYQIWRPSGVSGSNAYAVVNAGELKGLDYLPIRTAYANYRGFMMSTPTLESVAAKNLEHWQASSDHNSIVQMVRFPMFYATGVSEDEAEAIKILGPRVKLVSTNDVAKFGYAETSGAAVEQSFKDLERISREADERSVEALYKAGSDTATGRKIDLVESLSPAQRVARETERHINQVLDDFGKWLNRDVGSIKIDLDFGYSENEQMMIDALQKARATGDIPRSYYLKRLQQLGPIGDDVDVDELSAEADNEAAESGLTSQFGRDDGPDPQDDDDDDGNIGQPDSGEVAA